MAVTRMCSQCGRPNGPSFTRCMNCGSTLPEPPTDPPDVGRAKARRMLDGMSAERRRLLPAPFIESLEVQAAAVPQEPVARPVEPGSPSVPKVITSGTWRTVESGSRLPIGPAVRTFLGPRRRDDPADVVTQPDFPALFGPEAPSKPVRLQTEPGPVPPSSSGEHGPVAGGGKDRGPSQEGPRREHAAGPSPDPSTLSQVAPGSEGGPTAGDAGFFAGALHDQEPDLDDPLGSSWDEFPTGFADNAGRVSLVGQVGDDARAEVPPETDGSRATFGLRIGRNVARDSGEPFAPSEPEPSVQSWEVEPPPRHDSDALDEDVPAAPSPPPPPRATPDGGPRGVRAAARRAEPGPPAAPASRATAPRAPARVAPPPVPAPKSSAIVDATRVAVSHPAKAGAAPAGPVRAAPRGAWPGSPKAREPAPFAGVPSFAEIEPVGDGDVAGSALCRALRTGLGPFGQRGAAVRLVMLPDDGYRGRVHFLQHRLSQTLGIDLFSARQLLQRTSPSFLVAGEDRIEMEGMAEHLRAGGLIALLLDRETWLDGADPFVAVRAEGAAPGPVRLRDAAGRALAVSRADFSWALVAAFRTDGSDATSSLDGTSVTLDGSGREYQLLDVFRYSTRGPVRVRSDRFDFSCLGGARKPAAAVNLRTLLSWLSPDPDVPLRADDSFRRIQRVQGPGARGELDPEASRIPPREVDFTEYGLIVDAARRRQR